MLGRYSLLGLKFLDKYEGETSAVMDTGNVPFQVMSTRLPSFQRISFHRWHCLFDEIVVACEFMYKRVGW